MEHRGGKSRKIPWFRSQIIERGECTLAQTTRLFGRYEMNIDAKGRLFFPAKQREKIEGNILHITRGLDDCLFTFTDSQWDAFLEKMGELPIAKARTMERYFVGNSGDVEMDEQGRIKIPVKLRELAGLDREVTIVGLRERMEIWDTARWNAMNDQLSGDDIAAMLEDMNF